MRRDRKNQQGFSLVEIIVVLIMTGILAVMAGRMVAPSIKGYLLARDNTATAQKGRLAMARLVKELSGLSSVGSASANAITFSSYKNEILGNHAIALSGTEVTLDKDILVDRVDDFSLAYYDTFDGTPYTNWSDSRRIIRITLGLQGADNIVSVFTTRIVPRNI
ncbi:MAG: prepilin-type N-terminal cleavage/methylation domain-containing protein [Desulfobacterales bacterium]|nr:prepilin-type N-terminal cleavage/methylation domain-containing protein [Desulfobacterales bacterium]